MSDLRLQVSYIVISKESPDLASYILFFKFILKYDNLIQNKLDTCLILTTMKKQIASIQMLICIQMYIRHEIENSRS